MSTVIHPCPSCSKPAQLDLERLPDQPGAYPCPHCKQQVRVEKRLLAQADQAAAGGAQPAPLPTGEAADRRFNARPVDARFPSGILVGDDEALMKQIQSRLASVGSQVGIVDSFESARATVIQEDPELCILVTSGDVNPPYEPMAPLTGLPPAVRRHTYLALIGDRFKTLDGTEAFAFQVNMVLGKQDLEHLEDALYSGIEYHRRLYRPFHQAVEAKNAAG